MYGAARRWLISGEGSSRRYVEGCGRPTGVGALRALEHTPREGRLGAATLRARIAEAEAQILPVTQRA
eukprot:2950781-Prymnesium_polylepis.2